MKKAEKSPRFVQDLFDERAATQPDSVAVAAGTTQLTYAELARSANQMAHYLRGAGVGAEVLVGVSLERGADVVRCLLAILKAGGAYLPLDPALPAVRLGEMCAEAAPAVILTGGDVATVFAGTGARLLRAEDLAGESDDLPETPPLAGSPPVIIRRRPVSRWSSGPANASSGCQ